MKNTSLTFYEADLGSIPLIKILAERIWISVYSDILSKTQIDYMMEMMYSHISLTEQINILSHVFWILVWDNTPIGFLSYQLNYRFSKKMKLHKIYIESTFRGSGLGKEVIRNLELLALQKSQESIILNVNKNNSAINFYQKAGFIKVKEEQIDIGNGYIMDDFIMEKFLIPLINL
jgi:GNAT superfamily N-acetyltransferase